MENLIRENQAWIDETFEKLNKKLEKVAVRSREKLPYTTIDGVHDSKTGEQSHWWTNGFWGGMMWLMYNETKNEEYRKTAERSEELLDAALWNFKTLHHDVGFMWHLTSGANYRLTGNTKSFNRNMFAAASLMSRFNVDGNYIRAWNGEHAKAWSIIDCMMNIPILYWASKEIGDDRFAKVGRRHADMAITQHVRKDGSVNHIVEHDESTGEIVKVHGGQGYSETSCWSRGLAWAIYGTILSYIHTNKKDYLDAAIKTADYYLEQCKEHGYVPPVDFNSPKEPLYIDTTAGTCIACGLIEIAKATGEKKYIEAAIKTLQAIDEKHCNYSDDEDSIVQMGSERYPFTEGGFKGLHIPIIYGDFYFVEAILKLKGSDFLIW